jgi:hypothetical protein
VVFDVVVFDVGYKQLLLSELYDWMNELLPTL